MIFATSSMWFTLPRLTSLKECPCSKRPLASMSALSIQPFITIAKRPKREFRQIGCSWPPLTTPMPRFPESLWLSSENFDLNWLVLMEWILRTSSSPQTATPPYWVPRWLW